MDKDSNKQNKFHTTLTWKDSAIQKGFNMKQKLNFLREVSDVFTFEAFLNSPAHLKEEPVSLGHPIQLMFMFLQKVNVTFFRNKFQELKRTHKY